MTARTRVAVLISGRGSNLASLLEAARDPGYPADIVLTVASRADAPGLDHAERAGIATGVVAFGRGRARAEAEADLEATLRSHDVAFICLAGFMHVLSEDFVRRWEGRMLNIHPSLLPSFKGLDTHRRALAAGAAIHGCTVHFVNAEVDAGAIVAQAAVPILADDTEDTLAARVLAQEHRLYPIALAAVLRDETQETAGADDALVQVRRPGPA